jgi:DNA-binding response OmpR family regulator
VSRILIAEDDRLVSSFIEKGLRSHGYTTYVVSDGVAATAHSRSGEYDLMVLDLGLPERAGFEVLQMLRSTGERLPVIVLTGRRERGAVVCLENGADDYMRKPFHFEELLARIRARLRQAGSPDATTIEVGPVLLDVRTRRATVDGRDIELSGREFALLETFMRHADQVLTRDQLLSRVWGYEADPSTNVVNVYVSTLRNKLGHDVIETVRGSGYRFRRA